MILNIIIIATAYFYYSFGGWYIAALAALALGVLPSSDAFFMPIVIVIALLIPALIYDLAVNQVWNFPAPGADPLLAKTKQKLLIFGSFLMTIGMIKGFRLFR